jgi:hypothetical protein
MAEHVDLQAASPTAHDSRTPQQTAGFLIPRPRGYREAVPASTGIIPPPATAVAGGHRRASTHRDVLLGRLISGKLRVDDLGIQVPPSMQ